MYEDYRIIELKSQVDILQTVLLILIVLLVLFFIRNLYNLIQKRNYRKKYRRLIDGQTAVDNRLIEHQQLIKKLESDALSEKQKNEMRVGELESSLNEIETIKVDIEARLKEQRELGEYQRKALEKFANYKAIDANNTRLGAHFIKNVISHVYQNLEVAQDKSSSIFSFSLSPKGNSDVKISVGALKNMFALLDYNVSAGHKEKVTIEEEITHLKKFIDLLRFLKPKSKITLINNMDDQTTKRLKIKPTLFFPFLENALKHGSLNGVDSFIAIHVNCLKGTQISYEVQNSCETIAKQESNIDCTSPFGLNALKKLIDIYYPNSNFNHQLVGTDRYVAQLELTL